MLWGDYTVLLQDCRTNIKDHRSDCKDYCSKFPDYRCNVKHYRNMIIRIVFLDYSSVFRIILYMCF